MPTRKESSFSTPRYAMARTERRFHSIEDKLRIARKLDAFGIDYIEGGWSGSNRKDVLFFEKTKEPRIGTEPDSR